MRGVLRIAALLFAVFALGSVQPGSSVAAPQGSVVVRSVWSPALRHAVRTLVYLPPSYRPDGPRLPTLYLLHGTPGTPDGFFALGVEERLDSLIAAGGTPAMIVVAPSGGRQADSDTEWDDSVDDAGARWGTFVTHDLVSAIDAHYATRRARASRAIAGISMGGYGAVNLALGHAATFGIAASWSGYFISNTPSVDGPAGSATWRARSPLLSVARLAPALRRQPIATSFYSGRADRFFKENVSFHELLTRLRIPHRFRAVAGGHDASVWRAQMNTELTWIGYQFRRANP
jgi:enterochelin esterase-like enzyme